MMVTLTEASPSGGMLMSVVRPGAGSVQKSSALHIMSCHALKMTRMII